MEEQQEAARHTHAHPKQGLNSDPNEVWPPCASPPYLAALPRTEAATGYQETLKEMASEHRHLPSANAG